MAARAWIARRSKFSEEQAKRATRRWERRRKGWVRF